MWPEWKAPLGSGVGAGPPSAGGFLLEASASSFETTLVTSLFPKPVGKNALIPAKRREDCAQGSQRVAVALDTAASPSDAAAVVVAVR